MNIKTLCLYIFISFLFAAPINGQNNNSKLHRLSNEAELIVTGKVVNQKSLWNKDKSRITTQSTIEVEEYLKGKGGSNNIVITTQGGEIGEVGELYSHMPRFSNNEEVLVFVKQDKKDMSYKVLKGEEGKLTIFTDQKSGEKITSSNKKISTLKNEIKSYIEQK